jgi:hypothetical protein
MPQLSRPPARPAWALSLALGALLAAAPAVPAHAAGVAQAITDGKVSVDLRYRYQRVDQSGIAEDAKASTLRTRLGYHTGEAARSAVFLEFESVATLGPDDYNSTTNGLTTYPVVADPKGTEINQAYLEQHPSEGVTLKLGRQRIALDDGRFVGDEGWRQNQRTFDAVSVEDAHNPDVVFTYAYLRTVNDTDGTDRAHDSHLIHVGTHGRTLGDVSLFAYFVNDNDAPATASQTYGARYAGRISKGDKGHTLLTVAYARQGEMANSGVGSNDYMLGELGSEGNRLSGKVTYEVLGGDGTSAFSTPLGSNHGFDGWADRFAATPPDGLVDLAFTLGAKVAGAQTAAVYHQFKADSGGADYGTEWDLSAEKRVGAHTFGVAWAAYNADGFATDTEKLWVYAGASF